jgi:hypothetical protein
MSRKSTVRLTLVLLILTLVVSPSAGLAAPLREEALVSDLFGAARQWVLMLWNWRAHAPKAGCGIGPDGQPLPCDHLTTEAGCAIDPWGQPIPCQPVPTKAGCGIDPLGRPAPCS